MAKGDYYFPLFYQRFLTSTTGWTDEQVGAYLRLLIYQFDKGSIPNDPKKLKKIAQKSIKNWSLFESKFVKNNEGDLINIVMEEIRNEINNKKEVNKLNGKKGGRPVVKIKPNGSENDNRTVTKTETQTKPIPLTNNQYNTTNVVLAAATAIGSKVVTDVANESWKDQNWREQLCMGLDIKNESDLKKWMAQFNVSIAQDSVPGFDSRSYKKMLRGWIVSQKQKGTTVATAEEPKASFNHHLKKIG